MQAVTETRINVLMIIFYGQVQTFFHFLTASNIFHNFFFVLINDINPINVVDWNQN